MMSDMAYILSRTLENKIAIAENNDQNTLLVTLDVLKEILALLKEQQEQIDKLLEESASNAEMAEGYAELLKEQEAVEPKTGHWIFESSYCEAWSHTCSECGKRMSTAYNTYANYCWNCGAKMEGR